MFFILSKYNRFIFISFFLRYDMLEIFFFHD